MSENKVLSDLIKFRNENFKDNQDPSLLYISTANMNPERNGINLEGNNSLGKDGKKFYKDDILISNIRPYFKKIWKADRDGISSADVLNFIPIDENLIDSTYLYYLLSADNFFGYMTATSRGTKMPRGDKSAIKKYEVPNHPLLTQQGIANILSSFDDKIENNNAIIANLEEQAQAIFKSWFVDFEPFQKEEFIDNTIGLIPTSFESISLGELYKLRSGYAFKSKDWTDKGFPVIKIKDIQPPTIDLNNIDYVNDMNVIEKAVDFKVFGGEIVMALTGATTGKIGIIPDINEAYVNQRVGLFLDSTESGYGYLYGLLNQEQFISKVIELAQGSAQANLSPRDVNNLLVPYNKNAFEKYNSLINPMMSHIALILNENQSLRETRDTLLPKLMSGEIRVGEAVESK